MADALERPVFCINLTSDVKFARKINPEKSDEVSNLLVSAKIQGYSMGWTAGAACCSGFLGRRRY